MINMAAYALFIITFLTGIFIKLADEFEDSNITKSKILKILAGIIYGALLGYVIFAYPIIAPLWIGTIIGAILTGKIDALSHYVAMAVMLLIISFSGIMPISLIPLAVFAIVCTTEEMLHEYWITGKRIKNKVLNIFIEARPMLEFTAFIYSAITGFWSVWLALLCFDVGYILVVNIIRKVNK